MDKSDWIELLESLGFDGVKDFRQEQFKGAEAVADVYINSEIGKKYSLLMEAPTGIGKTLMYLGPLSIYDTWHIIISTSGKLLQKQISNTAEKLNLEHVVLMGRSNYLCKDTCFHYLKDMPKKHEFFEELTWLCDILSGSQNHELQAVLQLGWSEKFITFMKQHLTSGCSFCRNDEGHTCYYKKLEKKALESPLVILNHHALFSLRESSLLDGKILVADEAHALPEAASSVLSKSVSTGYLRSLQQRADLCSEVCADKVAEFRSMLEQLISIIQSHTKENSFVPDDGFWNKFDREMNFLEEIPFPLWVQNRCTPFYKNILIELNSEWHSVYEFIRDLPDTDFKKGICYFELVGNDQAALKYSPIETKEQLEGFWKKWVSTIGLSATLALPGKDPAHEFDYFVDLCGFPTPDHTYKLKSPFNYQKQCRVFIPSEKSVYDCAAEVNPELFLKERIRLTGSLIKAFDGRTLALYTAALRLEGHAAVLKKLFPNQILAQGEGTAGNDELAELFIKEPEKVLLGTKAFFQGFDAPGETLSCEVLEKLPFPRRDDPILKAKKKCAGNQWFEKVILPAMLMELRQAFGRLIRKESDYGIFILTDNRFLSEHYRESVMLAFCGIEMETFESPAELLKKAGRSADLSGFEHAFRQEWGRFSESALYRRITGMRSLNDLLKKMNIPSLYGWQKKIVDNVLSGVPAQFVIQPAGSGKSLTYQLPALMQPGLTLVISPLKALMYDQVDSLKKKTGFKDEIAYLNSDISDDKIKEIYTLIAQEKLRLLYVAPERLHKNFINMLQQHGLSMMVVDEAHMISEAGTQWRPSYGELKHAWELFGKPQVLALTATAEVSVKQEIKELFEIPEQYISEESVVRDFVKVSVKVIHHRSGYYEQIRNFVQRSGGRPVLIYCSTAENVNKVAHALENDNISVGRYHRSEDYPIKPEDLNATHQEFLKNQIQVLVATKAYGMGIDKQDIWGILYNNVPISLGELVQGAGRVCRDKSILDDYIKQGCMPEISVTYFEENDLTGDKGQKEWAINKPFRKILDTGVRVLNRLPARGNAEFPCAMGSTLNEDLMKSCVLLARFMRSEKMLKEYYFNWQTSEFHFVGISKKNSAEADFRIYTGIKMFERHTQLASVMDFCKKSTCRNNFLHTYFTGQTIRRKCYACDLCGYDLKKHKKYLEHIKNTSEEFVQHFIRGVFQGNKTEFQRYLLEAADNILEQIAYLQKEHLQSAQTYSDALFAATLLELLKGKDDYKEMVDSFAMLNRILMGGDSTIISQENVLEFIKQHQIPRGEEILSLIVNLQKFSAENRAVLPLQATDMILKQCYRLNRKWSSVKEKEIHAAVTDWIRRELPQWADFLLSVNFVGCAHYMKLEKLGTILSDDPEDKNAWKEWDNLKKYLIYLKKLNDSDEDKIIFLLDFIKTLPEAQCKEWELILQKPEEFLALQNEKTKPHEWNSCSPVFQSELLPCKMRRNDFVIAELESDSVTGNMPVSKWDDLINLLPSACKFYPELPALLRKMTELKLSGKIIENLPEEQREFYQNLPKFLQYFMQEKVFFAKSAKTDPRKKVKNPAETKSRRTEEKLNSFSQLSMKKIYGKAD